MTPVLDLIDVIKDYHGLRPLRLRSLTLHAGELIALLGLDAPAAEILVNLITGTTLPDRGEIRVFGQSTADIADSAEWMRVVDRFGIHSERAVLLDSLSVVQNLSIPFSLDIEPPSAELRARAVALAAEVRLDEPTWDEPVARLDPSSIARVRFGRALALNPDVVLFEHPTAALPPGTDAAFGNDARRVLERRGTAALVVTAQPSFADTIAHRVLTLEPSTGRLTAASRRGWLSRFRPS